LNCSYNKLTSIDLTGLNQLEKVECPDNYLTNFDYSVLNPDKLIHLNISDNNLSEQDLSVFKPLQGLTKLKRLHISNTDINSATLKEWIANDYYFANYLERKEWLDKNYPKDEKSKSLKRSGIEELDISGQELEGKLELEGFSKLKYLNCSDNKLTEIDLTHCPCLIGIDCAKNELEIFRFGDNYSESKLQNLKEFRGSNNKFSKIKDIINNVNKEKLTYFDISNNKPSTDLNAEVDLNAELFDGFTELQSLYINSNNFKGSLDFLKNLKKIIDVDIRGTSIKISKDDLRNNLPEWLEEIYCDCNQLTEFEDEQKKYYKEGDGFYDLKAFREGKQKKDKINKILKIPALTANRREKYNLKRIREDYDDVENYYKDRLVVYPSREETKFDWKINETLALSKLPLRLYCIESGEENKEKGHEIPKMREYYGNATITLIPINAKVGEENIVKLINSFKKKNETEFLYPSKIIENSLPILEKIIIDGRFMALIWKLAQVSEVRYEECKDIKELCKEKAATPVGLLYYGRKIEVDYRKDPESVLREAMFVATKYGDGDPLFGVIHIDFYRDKLSEDRCLEFVQDKGIKLKASEYEIFDTEKIKIKEKEVGALTLSGTKAVIKVKEIGNDLCHRLDLVRIEEGYENLEKPKSEEKTFIIEARKNLKTLEISGKDLEGHLNLKDFTNLEKLDCYENRITSLDLTNNKNLTYLNPSSNPISELDLSQNEKLTEIHFSYGQISSIDLSKNKNLSFINFNNNLLKDLDLTNNPNIATIHVYNNKLTFLKIANLSKLRVVACHMNPKLMGYLDLSNCPDLINLNCAFTGLEKLELNNPKLYLLYCQGSKINKLDLSKTAIKETDYDKNLRTDLPKKRVIFQDSQQRVSQNEEMRQKEICDFLLYVITKEMSGVYSIAEVVDDSHKRPEKTIFCYLEEGFAESQIKSLKAVANLVEKNGTKVCTSLEDVVEYLNNQQLGMEEITSTNSTSQRTREQLIIQEEQPAKKYPKEERRKVRLISVNKKNLEGELKLEEFSNLERVDCNENVLTGLHFDFLDDLDPKKLVYLSVHTNNLQNNDNLSLEVFRKFINLEELYIDNYDKARFDNNIYNRFHGNFNYPKEERNSIKELDISHENLIGKLDLNDFTSLTKLDCKQDTKKIKRLECDDNQISSLNFLSPLDSKILEYLNLNSNNLKEEGELKLSPLSRFKNLRELQIGNKDKKKIVQNIYNRFLGSLEPLKDLNNLKLLNIENTDIDNGIEYLPDNLEELYCANELRNEVKVKEIFKQLNGYGKDDKEYPEDNVCNRKYDRENEDKRREEITILNISNQKLKGRLKLEGFDKLKELNCSNNQLTNLDLIELDIGSNSRIPRQSLDFLVSFTGLKELNVENCSFEGSLESIKTMSELKKIRVSNTNIEEGLEYLSTNCKRFYCDRNGKGKSAKIVKEFGGGILAINDNYNQIGGAIGIASAFFETVFSRVKEDIYDAKEKKWEEFIRDTENL
ncbi:3148_t:CDS:10, partial [Entrophospora sp. SA101]